MRKILSFDTSCDDTAAAIVAESGEILATMIYSQVKEYEAFGGVVPEIGSRAHIEQIFPLTKALFAKAKLEPEQIDFVAATLAPGLIGPLLVGASFAKAFALARKIPFIGVHHIVGHVLAGLSEPGFPNPPFIALIASGGHSALYLCQSDYRIKLLGQTLDDAAGEAFDKIGRSLGLGYPAGKKMDELADFGDKNRFAFTIAMKNEDHLNFSFSGLKTQALNYIKKIDLNNQKDVQDICAGVREAIAQALCLRAFKALERNQLKKLVIGGGVAANSRLRECVNENSRQQKVELFLPAINLCTDNAVMIARAAIIDINQGKNTDLTMDVSANLSVEMAGGLTCD